MKTELNELEINGQVYVRKGTETVPPPGNRAVLVIDRGWIFAGDVVRKDGRIILSRAVHVRSWSDIGFDGMVKDPKSPKVALRKLDNIVDFPADAELFAIPVDASWGL